MHGPYKSGALPIRVRVLIVDDHEDTRDLYANVLRRGGFPVDAAGDAEAERVVGHLAQRAFDVFDGLGLCFSLDSGHLPGVDRQLVVLAWIEVVELIDPIQHVR